MLGLPRLVRLGRDSYSVRIPVITSTAMDAAILASPTATQRNFHSLDATRTSRKAAKSSRIFALRLQRVDGRRLDDAFVAGLHCSRLDGVATPTVSYVSAPLVHVRVTAARVHSCECVCVRASLPVCAGVFGCVSRYQITAIFEGINIELMEKSFGIFKVNVQN